MLSLLSNEKDKNMSKKLARFVIIVAMLVAWLVVIKMLFGDARDDKASGSSNPIRDVAEAQAKADAALAANARQDEFDDTAETFDEYCTRLDEWEAVSRVLFFKRSASFYFVDAQLIQLHFLGRDDITNFSLAVSVRVDGVLTAHSPHMINSNDELVVKSPWVVRDLSYSTLSARFDLALAVGGDLLSSSRFELVTLDVAVEERRRGGRSGRDLSLTVKRLFEPSASANRVKQPPTAMICTKCFYTHRGNDHVALRFWLELSKRAGFAHIAVCNQSTAYDARTAAMLGPGGPYAELVQVRHLRCVPNLLELGPDQASMYYQSFAQLKTAGEVDLLKIGVINQLVLNECYLTHVDKYAHVAMLDKDEAIVARETRGLDLDTKAVGDFLAANYARNEENTDELRRLTFDNFNCDRLGRPKPHQTNHTADDSGAPALLMAYVNEVRETMRVIDEDRSLYFDARFFFNAEFVDELAAALERVFFPSGSNDTQPAEAAQLEVFS